MRSALPRTGALLALLLAGCERFEAPDRGAPVDLAAAASWVTVVAPGGQPVHLVRNRARRPDSSPAVFQADRLVLRAGCLVFADRPDTLLIWPRETRFDFSRPGEVRVVDDLTGDTVRVGDDVEFSGLAGPPAPVRGGPAGCAGGVHFLDGFNPFTPAEQEALRRQPLPPPPPRRPG